MWKNYFSNQIENSAMKITTGDNGKNALSSRIENSAMEITTCYNVKERFPQPDRKLCKRNIYRWHCEGENSPVRSVFQPFNYLRTWQFWDVLLTFQMRMKELRLTNVIFYCVCFWFKLWSVLSSCTHVNYWDQLFNTNICSLLDFTWWWIKSR